MELRFRKKFEKDLSKLSSEVKEEIENLLIQIADSDNLNNFDIKKMKGYKSYYRLRMGDYRIGFEKIDKNIIDILRVAKRDEIYKIFP